MKIKQRFLFLFSVAGVSLAVIICIFFRADKGLRIDDNRRKAGDSIETSTESPLETLGKKLEELCLRGRISELEDYVVSERLTVEEAGLLAGQSQLLKHLSAYANNHWTITSAGICILQAIHFSYFLAKKITPTVCIIPSHFLVRRLAGQNPFK